MRTLAPSGRDESRPYKSSMDFTRKDGHPWKFLSCSKGFLLVKYRSYFDYVVKLHGEMFMPTTGGILWKA